MESNSESDSVERNSDSNSNSNYGNSNSIPIQILAIPIQFQFRSDWEKPIQFQFRNWNWQAIPIPDRNWPQLCIGIPQTAALALSCSNAVGGAHNSSIQDSLPINIATSIYRLSPLINSMCTVLTWTCTHSRMHPAPDSTCSHTPQKLFSLSGGVWVFFPHIALDCFYYHFVI